MPAKIEVDTRSNLSYEEFASEYLFPNKPVILENAASKWSAMGKWTPDFFKEQFPDRVLSADGASYKVADFIDILHASSEGKPAPYMHNQNISEIFPELVADVSPLPPYFGPNWLHDRYFPPRLDNLMRTNSVVEVYIGGAGGTFPVIHWDSMYTHAYLTQIYGEKELYVWAPDQAPYMYAEKRNNVSSVNDAANPNLDRYPLFAKAQGTSIILKPGQTLFVASGWWHTARMLSESITVSVNVANASNWANLSRDIVEGQRAPVRMAMSAYMSLLGALKKNRRVPG